MYIRLIQELREPLKQTKMLPSLSTDSYCQRLETPWKYIVWTRQPGSGPHVVKIQKITSRDKEMPELQEVLESKDFVKKILFNSVDVVYLDLLDVLCQQLRSMAVIWSPVRWNKKTW
jgi:hypothetical protein